MLISLNHVIVQCQVESSFDFSMFWTRFFTYLFKYCILCAYFINSGFFPIYSYYEFISIKMFKINGNNLALIGVTGAGLALVAYVLFGPSDKPKNTKKR